MSTIEAVRAKPKYLKWTLWLFGALSCCWSPLLFIQSYQQVATYEYQLIVERAPAELRAQIRDESWACRVPWTTCSAVRVSHWPEGTIKFRVVSGGNPAIDLIGEGKRLRIYDIAPFDASYTDVKVDWKSGAIQYNTDAPTKSKWITGPPPAIPSHSKLK